MKKQVIVGIDIGGTNLKIGIFSLEGDLLKTWKTSSKPLQNPQNIQNTLLNELNRFEEFTNIKAIGIGVPGLVRSDGVVVESPNFPEWHEINFNEILKNSLNVPVCIENDANLFTIGEGFIGSAKDCKNFVGITLGTGVGGGIVLNGKIYRGNKGMAGEIGHIVIHPSGPQCSCGKKGCLEAYSSATAIEKMMEQQTKLILNAEDISGLALKGDKIAQKIFEKAGYHLGIGIATIVNLLDIEMIVIGGGISKAWQLLERGISKGFSEHTFKTHLEKVEIKKSLLEDNAGIFGGFFIAKEAISNFEVS
ncbi:MAG: ROK family protein [Proteobacteria bacterium]|nr:ROK family protein [Pseudomonadota bacterium]